MRGLLLGLLAAAPLLLGSCAAPVVPDQLKTISADQGYRYKTLNAEAPKAIPKTAIILTFSGGGTRASALAEGALRALADTAIPTPGGPVPLSSQIDVISSVSGGSVTAAAFALNGTEGLADYEQSFLHANPTASMVGSVLLNPTQLAGPRIDVLRDYFDSHIFGGKTYQSLIDTNKHAPALRHP